MAKCEHPISMSGPMVRAILAGAKTQTRRTVKPQPTPSSLGGWRWISDEACFGWAHEAPMDYFAPHCPYGAPGDLMWVQEEWGVAELSFDNPYTKAHYRADGTYLVIPGWHKATEFIADDLSFQWCESNTMPRWACRLVLEIMSVRVERLQEISDVDAIDEGMFTLPKPELTAAIVLARQNGERPPLGETPSQRYRRFWNTLYESKGQGWDANPWVWVVEFKRVEG